MHFFSQVSIFTHIMIKCARVYAKKAVILYREIKDTFSIMKKVLFIFALNMLAVSMWGLGTNTFTLPSGNNYYSAYEVVKTNPNNYNWVQTNGSPGNSGSSYTAPSSWLDGGSGKPGYGYINVQSGRTVSFYVKNCTSVTVLGAANSSTRTLNLSVTNNETEVGSVATITGTNIQQLTYGTALDATKSYVITISASSAHNGKFHQILFVGGSSTGGGQGGGGETTTTYTITYDVNGHGTAPAQVTGATALPATLPTLTESGWTFGGWFTDQACTKAAVAGATISANTTLYAKWTQDSEQGGGQQGGSSTDCGELIKVVLSGNKAATQTVTGTVGGIAGVKNMGSSSPYKLNSDGAYVYIKLADGHYFQAEDVLTIDGSKAMEIHTGDVANGNSTMLDRTANPSNGVITYTLPKSLPANTNTLSVYRSSGSYNGTLTYMKVNRTCTGPVISTDATLSDLKVDGVTITGFAPTITTYNVTIPATQTTAPVVSATKNDTKAADPTIQQATLPTVGHPTTATVSVTAEDGTTTKTYTINFTRAELSHDADLKDIKVNGTSITGFAVGTTTYNVTVPFSATTNTTVTATTNNTAASAVVTGPNAVTGTATIVVTAEDGTTTKTYTVNITKAPASNDATLRELKYNGTSVPNFSAATLTYSVVLPYTTTTAANVTATANYSAANVQITQPTAAAGTATIVVTAENGTTTKTYTVTFTVADEPIAPVVPEGFHSPGQYTWDKADGGYGVPFVNYNNAQYEVYYVNRDNASSPKLDISTDNIDKGGYEVATGTDDKNFASTDGWLKGNTNGRGGETGFSAQDEFKQSIHCIKIQENYTITLKVCGYSEFALVAKDNNGDASKNRHLVVKIDGQEQTQTLNSKNYTIRRYTMSTDQHTIVVTGTGSSDSKIVAFSLKVGTTPTQPQPQLVKMGGNDTQHVTITQAIKPITYVVKYNRQTELHWAGQKMDSISLITKGHGTKYDTLQVSGKALCNSGTYTYHIVTYKDGVAYDSIPGRITAYTKIDRYTPDSLVEGFTGEAIEDIQFRYYALSADSVTLTWNRVAPAGISGNGANGIYTITGTPTQTGDFPFTISVKSDNNIVGMLRVQNSELGEHPILYLYKNSFDNAFYQNTKKNYNLIARKAKSTLRETAQYAAYDMIIISEDVDANNEEVMAAAEGQIAKPVLNMKGFTYAADRLCWGDPDNGSISNTQIIVMQPTHPVFAGLNATEGGEIQILDTVTGKGLMPVKVEKDQSVCLATAAIRGRDYTSDGKQQTFLHEIPAAQRNGQKYLLFPLAAASSDKLNANGKKLLQNCIDYLKNNSVSPVVLPELQIASFAVGSTAAAIDQTDNTIELTMPAGTDLTAVTPVVTVKDSKTHAEPKRWNKDGITVDLSNDYMGLDYIVTDYINVRVYTVYAHVENPEGLEEIYAEGEWINIYDIQGRKIMTTNESLHQLSLDRGMYIVVTTRGSFKILR